MEPRHEDDAAVVWLIDLLLPVRVLVAVDLCPRAPPVARSPRSDFLPVASAAQIMSLSLSRRDRYR